MSNWARARTEYRLLTCGECGEDTIVRLDFEYGTASLTPEECSHCRNEWTGSEESQDVDPREEMDYEPDDDYDVVGRYEPWV